MLKDRRGGTAILFAFSLPVLLGGASAAVEYGSLASRHTKLQSAADNAALATARELSLANADDNRVSSVASAVVTAALAHTGGMKSTSGPAVTAQVIDNRRGVQVSASETVDSFFGRLLTYPQYKVSVTATAKLYGSTRLCVLTLDKTAGQATSLDKNARISAAECSVFSNSGSTQSLIAKDNSYLQAERICTVGGYVAGAGNISKTPLTDCPPYDDPLAGRPAPPNASICDQTGLVVSVSRILSPGCTATG